MWGVTSASTSDGVTPGQADGDNLFRAAMDNSAVAMCLVAPDGTFVRVNKAFCLLLDRPAEVLMTSTWQEITHPDDVGQDQALVDQILAGERDSYRLRKRYLRPDGATVWGDLSVSCVRNCDGTVANFISQIIDVSEALQALRAAEEAERKFRLMATFASDIVFTAGPDRLITWVSPNITRTLGWQVEDLLGGLAVDFVHPDDARAIAPKLGALYSVQPGPDSHDFKIRWRSVEGDYRWMLGSGTRVLTADGQIDYVVAGLRDITDEVAAHDYLVGVLDSAIDPTIMFSPVRDAAGTVVDLVYADLNPAACTYLRATREAILGRYVFDLFGGGASQNLLRWCSDALATGTPVILDDQTMVSEVTHDSAWFDIRAVPINGQVSLTFRDITDRHRAAQLVAESEEKFRLLAENATDAVLHARDGVMVWLSPSLTRMLGWQPEEWIGHQFEEFTHPDDVSLAKQRRGEINSGERSITRLRLRDAQGEFHWVEIHASPFEGRNGKVDGIVASFRTIDTQVQAEQMLDHRARYDELTGLLNRAEIVDRLRRLLSQHPRKGFEIAVAFCDLDSFKEINDTHGHTMGDHVLKTVAAQMRGALHEDDLIARLGGDEILLVQTGVLDLASAEASVEAVRRDLDRPHDYLGVAFTPKISIGLTLRRGDEEPDEVIARADRAMYAAKQGGGNRVVTL